MAWSSPNGTSVPMTEAACEERLDGRRHLDRAQRLLQPVGAPGAHEHARLHERADALFEEEGRPLRALHEQGLQRPHRRVITEKGVEELVGARRGQRIDAELSVVCLGAPGVLVLRTIVDEEQDARGGEALHQRVHQRLRLGVDPVQVLEHHDDGLHLALPQE